MKIAFRVDSSTEIGSGHLMRCLTLADYLKKQGHIAHFLCRDHPGNLSELTTQHGHQLHRFEEPPADSPTLNDPNVYARWLGTTQDQDAHETVRHLHGQGGTWHFMVMDHYGLDVAWQRRVRPHVGHIFVIDDLANRTHDCDVLLDQNLNDAGQARYRGLVPEKCELLCGPPYALLRTEFEKARKGLRKRDGWVRRVLVFYGGMDKSGETLKACEALQKLNRPDIAVDVIVGLGNLHGEPIRQLCELAGFNYLRHVNNMAELMAAADLALGAGGTTTAERAYVGLPTIITAVADNQRPGTEAFAKAGAAWNAGASTAVTVESLASLVRKVIDDSEAVRAVGERAYKLFGDGNMTGVEHAYSAMRSLTHA